jgi:hypothetical protein
MENGLKPAPIDPDKDCIDSIVYRYNKHSIIPEYPSPDCSENPFVCKTKDCNGKRD